MNIANKLKDVPPHIVRKFSRELAKAKIKFDENMKPIIASGNMSLVEIEKQKLINRYKQLIRLYLKKYGIKNI